MIKYFLMHKNEICGTMVFDEQTGTILSYKDNESGHSPYFGNVDLKKMNIWWKMRSVPASRQMIREIVRKSLSINAEIYLAKNLALSMSDTYWVCPTDASLKYDDVRFSNLREYNKVRVPYHNDSSYDYNASLGGQMEKYWDLKSDTPILVKECSQYDAQQVINEVFATKVHSLQDADVPFVKYTGEILGKGRGICKCQAFTMEDVELISAYEMVESKKSPNDRSLYDHYIDQCVANGIDREVMQKFMDYQTLTDFIISNTDEHLQNFGVLRDANTMKLIGPAPIFDSGNSMFFSESANSVYSRVEMLSRKITSFYDSEEKMLSKVVDRDVVKLDLLPTAKEVKELYMSAGIDERKASFISGNYNIKVQMLDEFQHGKKISLYNEKEKEKELRERKNEEIKDSTKLIVMCGLPGSKKTEKAKEILSELEKEGRRVVPSNVFYDVEDAVKASAFIANEAAITNGLLAKYEYKKAITIVSSNEIAKEIEEKGYTPKSSVVILAAKAQIQCALMSGASVIYDATNLEERHRMDILNIAKSIGIKNTELYIVKQEPDHEDMENSQSVMKNLKKTFQAEYPNENEGWSKTVEVEV